MNEHEKLKAVLTSTQLYAEGVQRKTNNVDCIKAILKIVEEEEKLYEKLRYYEKGENDGTGCERGEEK